MHIFKDFLKGEEVFLSLVFLSVSCIAKTSVNFRIIALNLLINKIFLILSLSLFHPFIQLEKKGLVVTRKAL